MPGSFGAYTPILDGLNAAFFYSNRRPQYLPWHINRPGDDLSRPRGYAPVESIDGRHVFWDERKTLRAILDSYDLINTKSGIILLGVRAPARFTPAQLLGTLRVNASIERSATMRTIRTSFREDAGFLSLRFSSGEEVRFRIVPDNAAAEGLWLSPFPETADDLHTLLRHGAAWRVVAVRFSTGRLDSFYPPIVLS